MERAEQWQALRATSLVHAQPHEGGLRLTYRRSPAVDAELERLVAAERVCCGDANVTWDLSLGTNAVLEIGVPPELRGRDEVRIISEVISGS